MQELFWRFFEFLAIRGFIGAAMLWIMKFSTSVQNFPVIWPNMVVDLDGDLFGFGGL